MISLFEFYAKELLIQNILYMKNMALLQKSEGDELNPAPLLMEQHMNSIKGWHFHHDIILLLVLT